MTSFLQTLSEGLGLFMLGGSLGALAMAIFVAGDDEADNYTETDVE
jgi:hypothetical protein